MAVKLNNQQIVTARKLQDAPNTLRNTDIETLCSQDSVENMYQQTPRNEALEMAAKAIVSEGVAIKEQLQGNDVSQLADVNKSDEVARISGGTLAEVMTKITALLAGKTGQELENGADNFGAMLEIVASQADKCAQVVGVLAKDPIVVADMSDVLGKASNVAGRDAFKDAIERNCSDVQKEEIAKVSGEQLEERRQSNKETCEKQHYTGR